MVNPMEVGNWEQRMIGTALMLWLLKFLEHIMMSNKELGLFLNYKQPPRLNLVTVHWSNEFSIWNCLFIDSACAFLLCHNFSLVYNCRSERRPQNMHSNEELLVYATTTVGSDSSASIINTPINTLTTGNVQLPLEWQWKTCQLLWESEGNVIRCLYASESTLESKTGKWDSKFKPVWKFRLPLCWTEKSNLVFPVKIYRLKCFIMLYYHQIFGFSRLVNLFYFN